jgi:hypothetical protein
VEEKWGKAFHGTGPSCSRKTRRRWWRREVRGWKPYRHIHDSNRHRLFVLLLLYLLHGSGVMPSKLSSSVSEVQLETFAWKVTSQYQVLHKRPYVAARSSPV